MISWSWGSVFDLGAFQRAKTLRRVPLDRGRSEFEARGCRLFGLARPTSSAARARGSFPPRRAPPESRSHLGERGRSRAVLEAFEPAIDAGARQVNASGQARRLAAPR